MFIHNQISRLGRTNVKEEKINNVKVKGKRSKRKITINGN